MERCSALVSKVKSKSHIYNDLFFSILSKLPIKSLKRFACVHKSWSHLFDDNYFMTMYRYNFLTKDHSYYDDTSLLLHKKLNPCDRYYESERFELYSVCGERFENMVKIDWPNVLLDWPEYDSGFDILGSGSVHGILCLLCASRKNIILWNPTTMEFKLVPPSPFDLGPNWGVWFDHREFGYDSVNKDYKVMCHGIVIDETNFGPYMWEIYSLRSNSWKKLDVDMHNRPMIDQQLYIDGLSHWMCYGETYLLSFDWSNEVFITTSLPSDTDSVWQQLVLLNGSIALISNHRDTATFHISVLGELGVMESWTKIFIVGPLPCLDYPIGAGKKGDLFFRKKDGGLVWFDLNSQTIEDIGVTAERFSCKIVIHKESLLPFEGENI